MTITRIASAKDCNIKYSLILTPIEMGILLLCISDAIPIHTEECLSDNCKYLHTVNQILICQDQIKEDARNELYSI